MFRFRLQKLLDLREREEQQAQLRLAEAQRHRLQAEDEIRAATGARDEFDRRCAEASTEALRPIDLLARLSQVNALRDREERARAALDALQRQEDALRDAVLQEVGQWVGDREFDDDVTIFVITWPGRGDIPTALNLPPVSDHAAFPEASSA